MMVLVFSIGKWLLEVSELLALLIISLISSCFIGFMFC